MGPSICTEKYYTNFRELRVALEFIQLPPMLIFLSVCMHVLMGITANNVFTVIYLRNSGLGVHILFWISKLLI